MKLCNLCHWLLQRRRWPVYALALLALVITLFCGPVWLFLLVLSLIVMAAALCAIYLRDLHGLWRGCHLRRPAPRDGQAEIVMVDAALVDHGPMLLCAAQPIIPQLEMKKEEGQLLLGRAMLLLTGALPKQDAAALTSAAEAQLGLHLKDVRQGVTVLERRREGGMACLTVQEADAERTYFVGDAEAVLPACASIFEGDEHLLGADDHSRIRRAAQEMSSMGEHLYAFAYTQGDDEPTFLGLAAVGDSVDPVAAAQLRELRQMGVTVVLRDDGTRQMDVPVLRRNLDVNDLHARPDIHLCIANPYPDKHTLAIIRHEEHDLVTPVRELREHFSTMAFMLGRLARLLGLCLICCVLAGGRLSVACTAAVLTAGYLSFGSLVSARPIRRHEIALIGAACLLVRLLLNAAAPVAQDAAGTLLCLTLSSLLALTLTVPGRKMALNDLLPMLIVILVTLALQVLLCVSIIGQVLLPAAFCIVCGVLLGLGVVLTRR